MSLKGKTVLFFAGPLYEDLELWYPRIRLEEEGAATTVAGLGERTYAGKRGYPVTVDTNVSDVAGVDIADVRVHRDRIAALSRIGPLAQPGDGRRGTLFLQPDPRIPELEVLVQGAGEKEYRLAFEAHTAKLYLSRP